MKILSLPILIFQDVLANMNSLEFFTLTLCSKASAKWTLLAIGKKKRVCTWAIVVCSDTIFLHCTNLDRSNGWSIYVNAERAVQGNQLPYICEDRAFTFYWRDIVNGISRMLRYALKFYEVKKVDTVELVGNWQNWVKVVQWLKRNNLMISSTTINLRATGNDVSICTTLDQMDTIENIYIEWIDPTEDFIENDRRNFKCRFLKILYGSWVTIGRLLSMQCERIHVERTQMVTTNVNAFLRHWLEGGSPKLKYLFLEVCALDWTTVFQDVPSVVNHERLYRDMHVTPHTRNLTRADGTMATVFRGKWANYFEQRRLEQIEFHVLDS